MREPDRWEFVGTIAEDNERNRYINRYVGHLFTRGAQNPISYVNLGKVPANKRFLPAAAGVKMGRRN
jgi:hypothetical protein